MSYSYVSGRRKPHDVRPPNRLGLESNASEVDVFAIGWHDRRSGDGAVQREKMEELTELLRRALR